MGLYDGWNTLGLGQTVTNGLQRRLQREQGNWDRLGGVLSGLGGIVDWGLARSRDNAIRENAKGIAIGMGLDDVDKTAESMSGQDFLDYVLGQKEEREKLAHEDSVYKRNRDDTLSDRDVARSQSALDRGFATVSQNLQVAMSKARGTIPTAADMAEIQEARKAFDDFVRAHPEYGVQAAGMRADPTGWKGVPFPIPTEGTAATASQPMTMEDYFAKVDALVEDGQVSPEKMNALKEELIKANVFATLSKDPDFALRWDLAAKKIKGDKVTRDALMLGSGGVKTEQDARNAKKTQDENEVKARKNALAKKFANAAIEIDASNVKDAEALLNDPDVDPKWKGYLRSVIRAYERKRF